MYSRKAGLAVIQTLTVLAAELEQDWSSELSLLDGGSFTSEQLLSTLYAILDRHNLEEPLARFDVPPRYLN